MKISGYVPFFNNAASVRTAVASLRCQSVPVDEVFAVDDGSTDHGAALLEAEGIRVVRQPANLGRGAARARAMAEAQHELVVCCDATNELPPDFCVKALPWFDDRKVAAVFGRIAQKPGGDAVTRWRGRHLFRMPKPNSPLPAPSRDATLATYGAMVRRSACLAVGNYDAALRHTEDADLGQRLKQAGWSVVMDPALVSLSTVRNSLGQVLERYWRWNVGKSETISVPAYFRAIWFAFRVMAARDLSERDWPAAAISLYSPHYQFWRSVVRRATRSHQ